MKCTAAGINRRDFMKLSAGAGLLAAGGCRTLGLGERVKFGSTCYDLKLVGCFADAGYDFFESAVPATMIPEKDRTEWLAQRQRILACPLPLRSCNCFIPGKFRLTGPKADHAAALAFAETACRRADEVGVKTFVFGSSGARNAPEGWPKEKAVDQYVEFCKRLADRIADCDMTVVLEPLRPKEANFLNYVWEGRELVQRIGSPKVRLLADFSHMSAGGESPDSIYAAGDMILHCHVANGQTGNAPGIDADPGVVPDYFKAVAAIGYTGGISIEAGWGGIKDPAQLQQARVKALETMKRWYYDCEAGVNELSRAERADGWELAWDGATSAGWVGVKQKCQTFPDHGWTMENGELTVHPCNVCSPEGKWSKLPPELAAKGGGGDIVTVKKYRDFTFTAEFRLTKGANSGIKYFYDETKNRGTCEEYQVLDPANVDFGRGKDGNHRVAALYDLIPANAEKYLRPLGEWNVARIVSCGNHVEHWLNGWRVVTYERGSEAFRKTVAASKYATWGSDGQPWGEIPEGRILLQDHTCSTVSYRNLKIKSTK